MIPELDDWLPRPTLRVAHRRESAADPPTLWGAAAGLRLDEVPILGRLVLWRIPGTPHDQSFERLLRDPPFMVLQEAARLLVSGLVGRIWTPRRDYPQLRDGAEYRAVSEGNTARVAIGVRVTERAAGATIATEARVEAFGIQGQIGLTALRPIVRTFEHLLGSEALRAAVRRAEAGG